jgi:ribosome maturation protein SDO1
MTQTIARIRHGGKHFEILVDMDKALAFKKTSQGSAGDFLEIDQVFTDSKKGMKASGSDLNEAFGTEDVNAVSEKIVKNGDVLVTQEHRDEEKEKKFRQVIDFLVTNAIDPQTGNPHTAERIKNALEQAHVQVKNVPLENQINDIVAEISKALPIKIAVKRVKITVPAIHTGKVYGLINQYKENENWLSNGDLEALINVPAGLIMDFYDKLNSATHGAVLSEEIRE